MIYKKKSYYINFIRKLSYIHLIIKFKYLYVIYILLQYIQNTIV